MDLAQAIAILRGSNWCPGRSTAEHPMRAEIKAALAVLHEHRVQVESLGLVYVPPPDPEPEPELVPEPVPPLDQELVP